MQEADLPAIPLIVARNMNRATLKNRNLPFKHLAVMKYVH